ncbi:MAG: DUF5658 family protein [Candidatus Dormibacterales bacterium]
MTALSRSGRVSWVSLARWLALLAAVELADAITTGSGMAHGDLEANRVVATLLAWGGLGALYATKVGLVAVLGVAALLVRRHAERHPGPRASFAGLLVWRGTQACVIVLGLIVLHNIYLLTPLAR